MTDDEQPSRAELARRVEQLEQTVQRMLPSRRKALKIGGASVATAAAFGAGNATADPDSTQVGTIGNGDEDLDVEDITGNHATLNSMEASESISNPTYATLSNVPTNLPEGTQVYVADEDSLYVEDGT